MFENVHRKKFLKRDINKKMKMDRESQLQHIIHRTELICICVYIKPTYLDKTACTYGVLIWASTVVYLLFFIIYFSGCTGS